MNSAGTGLYPDIRFSIFDFSLKIPEAIVNIRLEIDRRKAHLAAPKAREVQQRLDEIAHFRSSPVNSLEISPALIIKAGGFFTERVGKQSHSPDRGAKIMRHRLNEGL